MMSRPRPDPPPRPVDFPSRWAYRQHRKAWLRRHGGSILWPLLIALTIGLLSGSAVVLLVLVAVAVVLTAYARSRP